MKNFQLNGFLLAKRRSLCCLIYLAILLVTLSITGLMGNHTGKTFAALALDPDAMQQEFDTTWRKTRVGWDDSSKWTRPPEITFERRIELIHPFALAGMILTSTLGMLIWASEEWQIERLLGIEALKEKRKQQSHSG